MISAEDKECFQKCVINNLTGEHTRDSIGKLAEKTVHAVVKDYLCPVKEYQEVKLGRYVADIFDGNSVTEIQTANFGKLRPKLLAFLKDVPVTVVLPLPHKKWIVWIDPETGARVKKNTSPVTGSVYEAFKEFYAIKQLMMQDIKQKRSSALQAQPQKKSTVKRKNQQKVASESLHPLTLRVLLIDMEEYRLLDGWSKDKKRGSHRYDRNPIGLYDDITLSDFDDYLKLIPADLTEPFTVKELASAIRVRKAKTGICVNVLSSIGAIQRVENKGRAYAYVRVTS